MKLLPTLACGAMALFSLVAANDASLVAYNGKFATEPVGNSTFLSDPKVIKAVHAVVGDETIRATVLGTANVTSAPLYMLGNNIFYLGCQQNSCGTKNWTISISTKYGTARVCYFDYAVAQDSSTIYLNGKKRKIAADCHRARLDWAAQ